MREALSDGVGARPVLAIDNLEVRYGTHVAVRGVTLDVEHGELLALLGPSGCGKTSLLRAIAGFERPSAGSVEIGGRKVAGDGAWVPAEKRRLGMVFQQGALFPHLRVLDNVMYGLSGRRRQRLERARAALEVIGMERRASSFPDQLSGGEQQRVALARALAPEPRIVLLDEPFASLDAALRQRLRQEVRSLFHKLEVTAVLVTHDQEEALSVGDRVAVMDGGELMQLASSDEIYHRPSTTEVARFIGDGQLIACRLDQGGAETLFGRLSRTVSDRIIDDSCDGEILLRPEDVLLAKPGEPASRPAATGARAGRIVERTFYGHDLIDKVRLDCGSTIDARVLSGDDLGLGERVEVRLRDKTYRVFPTREISDQR